MSIPRLGEDVPLATLTPGTTRNGPAEDTPHVALTSSSRSMSSDGSEDDDQRREQGGRVRRYWTKTKQVMWRHCAFVGPGVIASVGYTDPGNWVTDLAAGSQFGYALLFIVLLSGLFGIFLQILAVRMGVVTGNDLARNTRLLLLPDDDGRLRLRSHTTSTSTAPKKAIRYRGLRVVTLWCLYFVSEGALIATELAELLGSAIALNLLFPGLPLYGGVLVTCADVMLFLFIYKPQGNFRIFELLIAVLVLVVLACYIVLLVRVKPDWADVFHGYVPSSTLVQPQALYAGIGIVGAVIMPHALYLGSHFSTINRLDRKKNALRYDMEPEFDDRRTRSTGDPWHHRAFNSLRGTIANRFPIIDAHLRDRGTRHPPTPSSQSRFAGIAPSSGSAKLPVRMSIREINLHLPHAAWDIALSLFFFAITVNSAILIVAGAAFYYGTGTRQLSDLYDAFNLLRDTLGKPYAILFAIALLAAGQSASITCTLAGQLVSEGFIKWRTNAFVRRFVTRIITVIPSLAIAIGVGRDGLDEMLIASQVALSFALPFVLVPLIAITSMKSKMVLEDDIDQEAGPIPGDERAPRLVVDEPKRQVTQHSDPADLCASPTSADAIAVAPVTPTNECTKRHEPSSNAVAEAVQPDLSSPPPSPSPILHDFTNHWTVKGLAIAIYLVILIADLYTLVTTINGDQ